jgi:hypothetical protein
MMRISFACPGPSVRRSSLNARRMTAARSRRKPPWGTHVESVPPQHLPTGRRRTSAAVREPARDHECRGRPQSGDEGHRRLSLFERTLPSEHGGRSPGTARGTAHDGRRVHRGQGVPGRLLHRQCARPRRRARMGPKGRPGDHAPDRGASDPRRRRSAVATACPRRVRLRTPQDLSVGVLPSGPTTIRTTAPTGRRVLPLRLCPTLRSPALIVRAA